MRVWRWGVVGEDVRGSSLIQLVTKSAYMYLVWSACQALNGPTKAEVIIPLKGIPHTSYTRSDTSLL